ncbi:MAG: TonB-dependent receptor [Steroidobacteraceae bacterium]|jgi:iron complex outermembrane receptor protein
MLLRDKILLPAAAVLLSSYASLSFSQAAPATPAATAPQADVLEEVVITAQKRVERLEDVTVSAQVISAETLANADIADLSDLNKLAPSVQLNGTINGRVPTGVRGVSSVSNEGTVGISSGVLVTVDGVPVPSDSFAANNVAGIQNVEVLLGPQSTLGGRTAASGEINLVTRGPTDTLQGNVTLLATDDNEKRLDAFISGPLSSAVDGSLSVYGSRTSYPITNLQFDSKTTQEVSGVRAKLLFKLTDDLDVTLTGHAENTVGHGFNFVYNYITPGNDLLFTPGPFTQAALLPGITPSWKNLDYASPVTDAGADHHDIDYSVILNQRFAGGYTLTSTTAYSQENQHQVQDLFAVDEFFFNVLCGGCNVFLNTQEQTTSVQQTMEELKLVSPVDLPVSWLVGAFYSDVTVHELELRTLPPALLDVNDKPTTQTLDVYGRATWKLSDNNSLVTGLRYNHDEISLYYDQLGQAPYVSPIYTNDSNASNTLVGDIAFKHQFAPESMGYVSYSRGYSPSAYNTAATLQLPSQLMAGQPPMNCNATPSCLSTISPPVGEEHIDSFEIGSKGTYFNHTLTLNADLFYTIYHPYQIQSFAYAPGVLTPPLALTAVGKAETRGAELDAKWLATPTTLLGFNISYIDAYFADYANAPCYGLQTQAQGCTPGAAGATPSQNVTGDTMPNSPKVKFIASAEQRFPLGAVPWEFVLGGTYTYRSSAQMLPDQNPYAIQDAFGLLNLYGAFNSSNGKYSARLFVNNVTNHVYYTDVEDFWSGPWNGNAVIGQPARDAQRYAGIKLSASL